MSLHETDIKDYPGCVWTEVYPEEDELREAMSFWKGREPARMKMPRPIALDVEILRQLDFFVSTEDLIVRVKEKRWERHQAGNCLPEVCEFCSDESQ